MDYFKAYLFHEPNHKSGKDGRGDFFPLTHEIDDGSCSSDNSLVRNLSLEYGDSHLDILKWKKP